MTTTADYIRTATKDFKLMMACQKFIC